MKFCPYCGATLVGGAVSFCAECGKGLPSTASPPEPVRDASTRQPTPERKPSSPPVKKPAASGRKPGRPAPFPRKPSQHRPSLSRPGNVSEPQRKPKPDPNDGYDGYYNDVKPIDNGHIRDRTDPALIKRIVILSACAFVVVIFAVVLMYLL